MSQYSIAITCLVQVPHTVSTYLTIEKPFQPLAEMTFCTPLLYDNDPSPVRDRPAPYSIGH